MTEREFAEIIKEKGGTLYRVGGCVRDEIRGVTPNDIDFVVTGLEADQINLDKIVGQDFPVFHVTFEDLTSCEVALARKEKKNGKGYHGFTFFSDKNVTIEEDLARRDFTMNAMAKDVLTGKFIDPFDGADSIRRKCIEATSDAFVEDPLRVFRAARFAAQFNFSLSGCTVGFMISMKDELKDLKAERVWKEVMKALESKDPSIFFKYLSMVDCLNVWFPEVEALDVPDRHDGTAFNHTMNLLKYGKDALTRFGLLVHDFGKGLTPKEEHPFHREHDKMGKEAVNSFCDRLKTPEEFREVGVVCATNHMKARRISEMRRGKAFKWYLQNKKRMDILLDVVLIDSTVREGVNLAKEVKEWAYVDGVMKEAQFVEKTVTGQSLIDAGETRKGSEFGNLLLQRRISEFMKRRNEFDRKWGIS